MRLFRISVIRLFWGYSSNCMEEVVIDMFLDGRFSFSDTYQLEKNNHAVMLVKNTAKLAGEPTSGFVIH